MKIYFIRHGLATSNMDPLEGTVGQYSELTPLGREQMHAAAEYLEPLITANMIHASPSPRCQQSAHIAAKVLGLTNMTDDRLAEINKGAWEGRSVREVVELESRVTDEQRAMFMPPGGENWKSLGVRVAAFVHDMQKQKREDVVAISHNHPIMCGIGELTSRPIQTWEDLNLRNGSITAINDDFGTWQLDPVLVNFVPLDEEA
jgi:broad specificity phosphatase PhoE